MTEMSVTFWCDFCHEYATYEKLCPASWNFNQTWYKRLAVEILQVPQKIIYACKRTVETEIEIITVCINMSAYDIYSGKE